MTIKRRQWMLGTLGAEFVAKSPPHGCALLLLNAGSLAISPSGHPELAFNFKVD